MNKKLVSNFFLISAVGTGGYFLGTYSERQRRYDEFKRDHKSESYVTHFYDKYKNKITSKPGLPIFGTVTAATAVVPSSGGKEPWEIPNRVSQIMQFGFPSLDNIRSYSDYVLSYDRRNRVAHWVFEHITKDSIKHNDEVDRSKCDFQPDDSIHPYFKSLNSDYKGSGFDRGHLAAAGNHKLHQKHVEHTFYLTNMAPQVGKGFNRDSWNRLERHVRGLAKAHKNVYICTGPLYLPRQESDGKKYVKYQVIGANHVAVPTHFFKVVVYERQDNKLEMESYVMPNQVIDDNTPLNIFQVPPDVIERSAGLLFFDKISRKQLAKINGKSA